jgi:hypothetical protein
MTVARGGGRLIARFAPDRELHLAIAIDGQAVEPLIAPATLGTWREVAVRLPPELGPRVSITLTAEGTDVTLYHLWLVASE